ncbi:hypothetical protein ZQ72_26480 [Salmonella enterica subsp. enterica]|nr:hypothetical protein [Salmonella enterica subsp. enterica]
MELFENGQIIEPRFYHWENGVFSLRNRKVHVEKAYYLTESAIHDWRNMDLWPLHLYPKAAKVLIEWLFPDWDCPDWWWDKPVLPPSVIDEITKFYRRVLLTQFNTTIIAIRGADNAQGEQEG